MSLEELKSQLCQGLECYCDVCFRGTPFADRQNPPNVFRIANPSVSRPIAFIFDKPNDCTNYKNSELVPITIYDDRAGTDPRLPRAPSHSTLILLCRRLGLIPQESDSLESPYIYVTNAVKCDMCAATGRTGRVKVHDKQADRCRRRFLERELVEVGARALIFFGVNAQQYTIGRCSSLWSIERQCIGSQDYWMIRVPHTSPTPFNTHGAKGDNYVAPFKELCRQAGIEI